MKDLLITKINIMQTKTYLAWEIKILKYTYSTVVIIIVIMNTGNVTTLPTRKKIFQDKTNAIKSLFDAV